MDLLEQGVTSCGALVLERARRDLEEAAERDGRIAEHNTEEALALLP
ncbi:hypothetical protein [Nonomuraea endophytica]|uniref:Uncharacterized protein n=1 Tax=Nonomuraea endophytica TaxID=714136 RepID=A0A7W8EL93_9ACTN|nr:hypothetical protein [Nonomuraea endophytica]MBB5083649.1 hypothetical protein [Nonomuraea endophytica]